MFITFEGMDGSGKSTQLKLLADNLTSQGVQILVTREPGGSPLGKELRQLLLHATQEISPRAELFLYLSDRAQHVEEIIRPALEAGKIVLCDRFIDSTVAYQGFGRGLSIDEINRMNMLATGGLKPDKTILFDGPVEVLLGRAKSRSEADRLENETIEFYDNIRAQYLTLAKAEHNRFVVLDATKSIDELQTELIKKIATALPIA